MRCVSLHEAFYCKHVNNCYDRISVGHTASGSPEQAHNGGGHAATERADLQHRAGVESKRCVVYAMGIRIYTATGRCDVNL